MADASAPFEFLPLGAIIQKFLVGETNIVQSFPTAALYESHNSPYFGETIGRVANRVSGAKINSLNGKSYPLVQNDGPNALHGGVKGWGKRVWQGPTPSGVRKIEGLDGELKGGESVTFKLTSEDGDEGYPGTVEAEIIYTVGTQLSEGREVRVLGIEYEAKLVGGADETVVNITNHSYFNLSGLPTIEGTEVTLNTNSYLPVDNGGIPNNGIDTYKSITPNKAFTLGAEEPAVDDCFIVNTDSASIPLDTRSEPLAKLVTAYHPSTKIHLEVLSTEPAYQFYTGGFIDVAAVENVPARGKRSGFCVEPSRYVNAPNVDEWKSQVLLKKGQVYGSRIVVRFVLRTHTVTDKPSNLMQAKEVRQFSSTRRLHRPLQSSNRFKDKRQRMAPSVILQGSDGLPAIVKQEAQETEPALLHRSLLERPIHVENATGIHLHLRDGRTIIDACAGAAVAAIGHGNMEVIQAAMAQMVKVSYVHTMSYTTDAAEDLARLLLRDNRYGLEKAYFVCSGSEANESAIKVARQYFFELGQKERMFFVSRRQAYHGNSIGSMSLSTNRARKIPYEGAVTLPHVAYVEPAYAYQYQRTDESEDQYVGRLLRGLEQEFLRIGPKRVAAFVAEPVVGATAGCVTAPTGYFKGVRRLCDQYGILLVLDEIMCGMGRTGTYFAFEQENIEPDIVTIGKGLSGGYAPIAGVLVHKKVVDVLRQGTAAFNHGHTYQAHPVSCAAALAVQTIIRRENLVERCAVLGNYLGMLLRAALGECKFVGDIRGRGLFWAVEFVADKQSKRCLPAELRFGHKIQQRAFDLGVAVYPGAGTVDGVKGDHVLLAPPFTVERQMLARIVDVLKEAYIATEATLDVPSL
ncbi:aminotransferase class-III [Phlyctema vagabunda]|uniref:Aminotransferase class-III n=1 Tax=Phlyctema vagabunda TaxID=108571 RepID=A0ABR4PT66_9HELO